MLKNNYLLIVCTTLFIGCSLPNTKKATATMDKYWTFYKAKQYDSLKSFYLKSAIPEEQFPKMFEVMEKLSNEVGNITQIKLTQMSANNSTNGGKTVELTYQAVHERGNVEYEFKLKAMSDGEFKIQDQSFSR
jgi:hypothetical protein